MANDTDPDYRAYRSKLWHYLVDRGMTGPSPQDMDGLERLVLSYHCRKLQAKAASLRNLLAKSESKLKKQKAESRK